VNTSPSGVSVTIEASSASSWLWRRPSWLFLREHRRVNALENGLLEAGDLRRHILEPARAIGRGLLLRVAQAQHFPAILVHEGGVEFILHELCPKSAKDAH
jgi:hypothetical protein